MKKTFNEKEVFLKKNLFPELFVSRNVGNSIKMKEKHYPSPHLR